MGAGSKISGGVLHCIPWDIDKHPIKYIVLLQPRTSTEPTRQANAECRESLRECVQNQGLGARSPAFYPTPLSTPKVSLQNISVPAPIVSFFPLRILDGREPSVKPRQPLNGLGVACITGELVDAGPAVALVDEHTAVVDTIDDFVPQSSVTSPIFGP